MKLWLAALAAATSAITVHGFATTSPHLHSSRNARATELISRATADATTTEEAVSQLTQLSRMTVLSIDSGDLDVIRTYAATGAITDATTNPLFVSQAGLDGNNQVYAQMVADAVEFAVDQGEENKDATVALAMDRLAVLLGKAISDIVPGYISTEVDPRLSFDCKASVDRARRIIQMYSKLGVSKERVLVKLAATWEGIQAAHILETEFGIRCNLTLVFGITQAIACAQYGAHLISPFPGRILDWHKAQGLAQPTEVSDDPGVQACRTMHAIYHGQPNDEMKSSNNGFDTICMPASWRPSRGPTEDGQYDLDEIRALAGADRMTIPAPLLEQLAASTEPLERQLFDSETTDSSSSSANVDDDDDDDKMTEAEFRLRCTRDGCINDKLAEGLRAFIGETEKLEAAMRAKVQAALS